MRLNDYEKRARKDIDVWQHGEKSLVQQALNLVMMPVDWVVDQVIPDSIIDQASDAISGFLSVLNDASEWSLDDKTMIKRAAMMGIEAESLEELREIPLEDADRLARTCFSENALLAAIEGGGTGLGGAALIIADIPLLFSINFRVIQQIGSAYGFSMKSPEYEPLVLSIFNVAASGSTAAKSEAVREMSVAASAFARDSGYKGRTLSGTFQEQNRHVPREIAKNLIGKKLGQMIPLAGAAVGAGVNWWFTTQTAESAFMLFRALHLERKERS